jgi:Asp/Glu/hydantoin racemase
MFNISDYFKKFTKIEGTNLIQSDAIKSALYKNCGIDDARFEVRKDILYILGAPMIKSAVYTKKASILAHIKESIPTSRISDIR